MRRIVSRLPRAARTMGNGPAKRIGQPIALAKEVDALRFHDLLDEFGEDAHRLRVEARQESESLGLADGRKPLDDDMPHARPVHEGIIQRAGEGGRRGRVALDTAGSACIMGQFERSLGN